VNFAIPASGTSPVALAPSSAAAVEHRKLADAAQQFEGMLLQEMLKPIKEHGFCQEEGQDEGAGKDGGDGFGDTLSSFGTEAMAGVIAKSGGMGIAKRVVEQVEGEKASHARAESGEKFQNKTAAVLKSWQMAPMS
jgi:Rod binding domain-containing protein